MKTFNEFKPLKESPVSKNSDTTIDEILNIAKDIKKLKRSMFANDSVSTATEKSRYQTKTKKEIIQKLELLGSKIELVLHDLG